MFASIGNDQILEDNGDGSFGLSESNQAVSGEKINGASGLCTYSLVIVSL